MVTAWLYAAGWSYAYTFFDRYHIPLLMLDIPLEHMLMYGGFAVEKNIWSSLALSGVLVAALWAMVRWSSLLGRLALTVIITALVIGAFALARVAGDAAAWSDFLEDRVSDYHPYPRVELAWEGVPRPSERIFGDILSTDCGRLLAVSRERLFLIRPVRTPPGLETETFVVDSKNIKAMRLRGEYTSCD